MTHPGLDPALGDPARLAALGRTELLDSPCEEAFDRLVRLAQSVVGVRSAVVSLIDQERHFIKSCIGVPDPWASRRELPLSHSYSKYVIASGQQLVITDARLDPAMAGSPAIAELGAIAYVGTPLRLSGGQILGTLCVIDDKARAWTATELRVLDDLAQLVVDEIEAHVELAERKRCEQAHQESGERFRQLAEHNREIYWIHERAGGELRYLSPTYEAVWGRPAPAPGEHWREWLAGVHPEDRARVERAVLESGGHGFREEYRILRPDGVVRWIRARTFPISGPAEDSDRVAGVAEDITEWKEAEERAHFRELLLDQVGEAVIACDLEGTVTYWNRTAESQFGWSASEVLGRNLAEALPQEGCPHHDPVQMARIRGGESWSGELLLKRKDGTTFPAVVNHSPIRDRAGEVIGVVGVAADLTECKRLEEQLHQTQKMEAVGRLAGGVAHDFNNILTAISGHVELVLDELAEGDALRADLDEIQKAAGRATALARQLLTFGRGHAAQSAALDLNLVVREIETMLRRLIGAKVALSTRLSPALALVHGERSRLEQVILNLAVNARDAMAQGGQLWIETHNVEIAEGAPRAPVPAPGAYVLLTVRDTGEGMDALTLSRIFEPFFSTKERGKGTGLGLSTVYGIVRQLGGAIDVQSRPGQGTAFFVYLPRAEAAGSTPPPLESTRLILVAEDDSSVRALVRQVLEVEGYQVIEAADGREALDIATRYPGRIHLLVTDVIMPHMDGIELARRLTELRPDTPSLFMSGYVDNLARHAGIAKSEGVFLDKPFAIDVLLQKVREAIR